MHLGAGLTHTRTHTQGIMTKTYPRCIADAGAFGLFASTVDLQRTAADLWPYRSYRTADWKKKLDWPQCKKASADLAELFHQTEGRQLKHVPFFNQLTSWLLKQGVTWHEDDTERACYRIRAMMAQLRDFKRLQYKYPTKTPPRNYECMGGVLRLSLIHI